MKERIKGRKLLRLFLVCVLGTALLSGCGGMNRYQTMELETETEAASGTEDMTVITMGETAAEEDGTEAGESSPEEAAAAEPETEKYHPVDETVVVKADLLNVRKEDRADARIYVQLKNGEKLRRIGYNEEWSQVEYDGKTAYVASDLVEVWVEETDAPEAEPQPAVDGAGAVPADASGRRLRPRQRCPGMAIRWPLTPDTRPNPMQKRSPSAQALKP